MASFRKRNSKWEARVRRQGNKAICKTFTNIEDADCALKMMSVQYETSNKVSSSNGSTTQKIIIEEEFDIGDSFFGLQEIVDNNYRSSNSSSSTNCRIVQKHWGADMVCR